MVKERNFSLVLGGGGLKGLAHVGVLEALEEEGALPNSIVGSSVGALVAATWCAGMPVEEMKQIALDLRRRDLFQVAHRDMALKRMRSPALYRQEPMEALIRGLLGEITFEELKLPLIVNTVDLNAGTQVFWGAPGLRNISVADAVYASLALPGYLPPKEIEARHFVDGATVANLPVAIAATAGEDLVVAVDVGASGVFRSGLQESGFAAIYARAVELAVETMRDRQLKAWSKPPLLLLQPRVEHIPMFSFFHNRELLDEGYRATREILDDPSEIPSPDQEGIFPRRRVTVRVEKERCVGCGACLVHGPPGLFEIGDDGLARVTEPNQTWSPADGGFVRHCPTYAIMARRAP